MLITHILLIRIYFFIRLIYWYLLFARPARFTLRFVLLFLLCFFMRVKFLPHFDSANHRPAVITFNNQPFPAFRSLLLPNILVISCICRFNSRFSANTVSCSLFILEMNSRVGVSRLPSRNCECN